MAIYVGLDIGGTKFMAVSSGNDGDIIARSLKPAPYLLKDGLTTLNEMIDEVSEGRKIAGIGASIGGPINRNTGLVSPLHQPEWRNVPLKDIMESKWHCPFYFDVDTNIAALGEYRLSGENAQKLLYITLSTGMGGGYLIGGKIYRGMGGFHPEIGHQAVNYQCSYPQNIHCECGVSDCLEALVSGNGIRRIYKKAAEELTEEEWKEVTFNLAQGVRNLAAICLPDVIVLGGGIAFGRGEKLVEGVRAIMKRHLSIVPVPDIRISHLGYDTALMGALVVAREGLD